jgi:hypothetical protein
MSSRDSFWFLAGALTAVAILVVVRAWLRERPAQEAPDTAPSFARSFVVPVVAALALIAVALGIYFLLGSPDSIASDRGALSARASSARSASMSQSGAMGSSSGGSAGSLEEVTRSLANRLATKGGSDDEWKLLAESYEYLGRTADAKAARAHSLSTSTTDSRDAEGTGTAEVEPVSGGQIAAVADALDSQGSLDGTDRAVAKTGPTISGTVELASELAAHAPTGATLFIYVKQLNAPGPPLAVLRVRADHWPVTFSLSDDNAMVPGRNLSGASNVQVEARISRSGDAIPRSGDLVGSVAGVNPRAAGPVKVSINREIG